MHSSATALEAAFQPSHTWSAPSTRICPCLSHSLCHLSLCSLRKFNKGCRFGRLPWTGSRRTTRTHLDMRLDAEMEKKRAPEQLAMAFPMSVLPVPCAHKERSKKQPSGDYEHPQPQIHVLCSVAREVMTVAERSGAGRTGGPNSSRPLGGALSLVKRSGRCMGQQTAS